MAYYPMDKYKIVKFERSKTNGKKYTVLITDREGKIKKINFGDSRYEQFKDSTPLKLYSKLDHLDSTRRKNYIKRHSGFIKPGYFSPVYFSMKYLW